MKRLSSLFLVTALILVGCSTTPEQAARDAIASAHGYITSAQAQWQVSCTTNRNQLKCNSTNKLIVAEHTAADALGIYCGGPSATGVSYADGGTCVPQKSAGPALQSAIMQMNAIVTDVKNLLAKGN